MTTGESARNEPRSSIPARVPPSRPLVRAPVGSTLHFRSALRHPFSRKMLRHRAEKSHESANERTRLLDDGTGDRCPRAQRAGRMTRAASDALATDTIAQCAARFAADSMTLSRLTCSHEQGSPSTRRLLMTRARCPTYSQRGVRHAEQSLLHAKRRYDRRPCWRLHYLRTSGSKRDPRQPPICVSSNQSAGDTIQRVSGAVVGSPRVAPSVACREVAADDAPDGRRRHTVAQKRIRAPQFADIAADKWDECFGDSFD